MLAAGDLDLTFGTGGRVTANFSGNVHMANAIAIQGDGRLVVGGSASRLDSISDGDFGVVRFNANGSLDTSFGVNGEFARSFGAFPHPAGDVALLPDGRIVAAGIDPGEISVLETRSLVVRLDGAGNPDNGFGQAGVATHDAAPGGSESGVALVLQPDGKVVTAGTVRGDTEPAAGCLVRWNTNGSVDAAFGVGGVVTAPAGTVVTDVALQNDGKLLMVGLVVDGSAGRFLVLRYNPDGTPDAGFGNGGLVSTDFPGAGNDSAFGVVVQADGKIVVAGTAGMSSGQEDFALARYFPDGSLDLGFGAGGLVRTDFAGFYDEGQDLVLLPDGDLVVVGRAFTAPPNQPGARSDFALARYNHDGALAPGFGNAGKVTTSFGPTTPSGARAVAVDAAGNLVVVGTAGIGAGVLMALARYGNVVPAQPPLAVDDTRTTAPGIAVDIPVLINDSDPNGDPLTISAVGSPIAAANGMAVLNGDFIRYTPNPGFVGADTFSYTIDDGLGGADTATVTVNVDDRFGFAIALGSTEGDIGLAVATDGANVYVTGVFTGSADFDASVGVTSLTSLGSADVFVAKYSSIGELVWARQLGGTGDERGSGIAADGAGNVYVTGNFAGTVDFDPGAGTNNLTSFGGNDIFVSKLDSAGNFVYARQLGGVAADVGSGIAVDASGNAYTTGFFQGTADFDPGAGVSNLSSFGGSADIFVSKLDSAGNFMYARQLGGIESLDERGNAIAVDGAGNVYTTGAFDGTADFDPGPGTNNLTPFGAGSNIFVSKLDSGGNFVYARQFGAPSTFIGIGRGIAVDGAGNVYTTGDFQGTADFDPGPGTSELTSFGDTADAFVCKLDGAGNFVYARQLGGGVSPGDHEQGLGIAVDGSGNVYSTGFFIGTADFDPGAGVSNLSSFDDRPDIFVSKLDTVGNFVYARQFGGPSSDTGFGIAVDGSGNAYATGFFLGTADFDPGANISHLAAFGGSDIFVIKLPGGSSIVPDTIGLFAPMASAAFLRHSNAAGAADVQFAYGPPGAGWLPITGDWNGDGVDTLGLFNPVTSTFFLRNSNTAGIADLQFAYGPADSGWLPIAGDWNGDGTDTVGLYAPNDGVVFLRNLNAAGIADLVYAYGPAAAGWLPIAGDWDGNGTDTIGLYAPNDGVVFLRNQNAAGIADLVYAYGPAAAGWLPIAGDWDGNGTDTIGLYAPLPGGVYLRNAHAAGAADVVFSYGPPGAGWLPIAGNWTGAGALALASPSPGNAAAEAEVERARALFFSSFDQRADETHPPDLFGEGDDQAGLADLIAHARRRRTR